MAARTAPGITRIAGIFGWIAIALSVVVLLVFGTIRILDMANPPPADRFADRFGVRYAEHPWVALIHIIPGLLFLVLAPLQFIPRIRSRHLRFHRGLGRVLVVCAAISGVFALLAAFRLPAFGGISTQAATVFFGVIFLFAIAKGFLHIRRRQIRQHREWMIRVMALAMGVATIRLFIALFTALFGLGFEEVFGTSFWLGLGFNLLVAEVWINHTRIARRPASWASLALLVLGVLVVLVAPPASAQSRDTELRRMATQLLPRVEELSGLEAKRPIVMARRSRSQLRAYLSAELERELASGELRNGETVYKLLELIPRNTDLKKLASELLGEQILGYYDPRSDTLYVLEDVSAARLRPVLVHEMVHALQDQHTPLDSLRAEGLGNDRRMAASAAIEGHATLVMLRFAAEEATGKRPTLAELPDLSGIPLELFVPDEQLPVIAAAPRVLREALLFPYLRGTGFVRALQSRDPSALPFGRSLPLSTEQVLDPAGHFIDARDDPTEIVFDGIGADAGRWKPVYQNTLGEFELSVLLKERHFQMGAEKFASGWDGDRYLLLFDGTRNALVWYLVWDDAGSAYDFANAYRQILHTRLGSGASVEELTVEGRPVVRIVETEDGVDLDSVPLPEIRLTAERG